MPPTDPRAGLGRAGEEIAEAHLARRGYVLVRRRFRIRNGEIDLVMRDGRTLVFVEVRRRLSAALGDPLESIGARKRERIVRAARVFLSATGLADEPCRFDVVAIRQAPGGGVSVEHRIDAFRADGRIC